MSGSISWASNAFPLIRQYPLEGMILKCILIEDLMGGRDETVLPLSPSQSIHTNSYSLTYSNRHHFSSLVVHSYLSVCRITSQFVTDFLNSLQHLFCSFFGQLLSNLLGLLIIDYKINFT